MASATMRKDFSQLKEDYLAKLSVNYPNEDLVRKSVNIAAISSIINSERSKSQTKTMLRLLQIFEHRKELSETNTCILKALADVMDCSLARQIVEEYEKSHGLAGSENICKICALRWRPPVLEMEEENNVVEPMEVQNNESEIDEAINIIRPYIVHWRDLSRHLGLTEGDIGKINSDNETAELKLNGAVNIWKNSGNRSVQELVEVLREAKLLRCSELITEAFPVDL